MGVGFKDLINRTYKDKECVAFCIDVRYEDRIPAATVQFTRLDETVWQCQLLLPRTPEQDSSVYTIAYQLPKLGIPLELVGAIGLRCLQQRMEQEIQQKQAIDFAVGDLLQGML